MYPVMDFTTRMSSPTECYCKPFHNISVHILSFSSYLEPFQIIKSLQSIFLVHRNHKQLYGHTPYKQPTFSRCLCNINPRMRPTLITLHIIAAYGTPALSLSLTLIKITYFNLIFFCSRSHVAQAITLQPFTV